MKKKLLYLIASSLLTLTTIGRTDVRIDLGGAIKPSTTQWMDGPKPRIFNATNDRVELEGWRFYTLGHGWDKLSGDQKSTVTIHEEQGKKWHTVHIGSLESRILPPKADTQLTTSVSFQGMTVEANKDASPYGTYLLMKTGAKGMPSDLPTGEPGIDVKQIETILKNPAYANADYRYLDTLGIRGGIYSGRFIDTYTGETQLLVAIPKDSFKVSNTWIRFVPENTLSPLYMMSCAMLQEYFNEDMQWQLGIGFKETFAATSVKYIGDNSDGAYGCFEIEKFTFASVALSYPYLFPDYSKQLLQCKNVNDLEKTIKDAGLFTGEYCGPGKETPINSAYVVNCAVGSSLVFWRIYDLLGYAESVCWKEVLEQCKDPYIGIAVLSIIYNRGLYHNADSILSIGNYKNYLGPDANEKLPTGFGDYRKEVLGGVKTLADASKKSMTDKSVQIYDVAITLDDIKAFLFGDGGSVDKQGSGGLLKHFNPDRSALWSDAKAAFTLLAARSGGTSISYRYDYLTFLRALKKYFVFQRPRPLDEEIYRWLDMRNIPEEACGCDGQIVDKKYPVIALKGAKSSSDFRAELIATDNHSIKNLSWTMDYSWARWSPAQKTGGSDKESLWRLTIPAGVIQTAKRDSFWVSAQDSSGNATVIVCKIKDTGTVAIDHPHHTIGRQGIHLSCLKTSSVGMVLQVKNLSVGTPASIDLFDCSGRRIATLFNGEPSSSTLHLPISASKLRSGIVIIRATSGSYSTSFTMKYVK